MFFLQETPIPDNLPYLILGLLVLFLFFGTFIASLIWRMRNLHHDMVLLEQMAKEDALAGDVAAVEKPGAAASHPASST